ncbi:MAG TPA: IS110 family transposase [Polyangiaceae bacterium]|nr:IS110 family transposase [Polyangiaceae bacterium]
MGWFAGLDWGSERHAVCVVDSGGRIVAHFEVVHDAAGLRELRTKLVQFAPQQELPIAIERPSGLIIDALVEAGHVVVPIHPNVVKACRPRYRAAGGKSDLGDSYLLADVLRTDGHRFRPLVPQSDAIKALRALVRTRDDLVAKRIAIANQLRALLESFWPGAVAIFADIDSPIALAFVQRYPTPKAAASLGPKRLGSFLAQNKYCGRRSPVELLERLHAAPVGLAGVAEANAKGELVLMLARVLEVLVGQLALVTARIEHEVAQLADGRVIMSFPRAGRINAAQILAELGDVRQRFQTEDQLAAEAGVSPVTHESGKSRGVTFRWACNRRLRSAITSWADNSRRASPWANDVYARARARGCDHPHAVRILARAWIRILWRAWVNKTSYQPANHRAAKRFLTPAA